MKTRSILASLAATLVATLAVVQSATAENIIVSSPDSRIKAVIDCDKHNRGQHNATRMSVDFDGRFIAPSEIGISVEGHKAVGSGNVLAVRGKSVHETIAVPIGKNSSIDNNYNEATISYDDGAVLTIRAYNNGIAYRWATAFPDSITIENETLRLRFARSPEVYYPECDTIITPERDSKGVLHPVHQGYHNFERLVRHYPSIGDIPANAFAVGPTMFRLPDGRSAVVTESNCYDYPGLYLIPGRGHNTIEGHWAGYPRKCLDDDPANSNRYFSNHLVFEREPYIARTQGTRVYPWRVIAIADNDADLLNNELVYQLADPCEIADISWIEPGRTAWEWWHKAVVEGVDFPVGNKHLSEQLYRVYIDWAARNGIEYMTLDAGWSDRYIKSLCDYAHSQGVKIICWTWASCVREFPGDYVAMMKSKGVDGLKIDFFERNDQQAMTWQREMARRCAEQQMVICFHGCPVPSGLNRTFPNVLNYEAVRGAECNFWESTLTPEHHVTFPFTRSIAGPEDYTPGSMRSVRPDQFRPYDIDSLPPLSMGTRAHEMALFVVLDQWLATICDSPSEYDKAPEINRFLSEVPSTWDETRPISGRIGEHILIAKRKGRIWWVGALTNSDARTLTLDLSFLPASAYQLSLLSDVVANTNSTDKTTGDQLVSSEIDPKQFKVQRSIINTATPITLTLAPGGGAVLRLIPLE